MKPYNLFIVDVNDGQTNAALTGDLHDLIKTVQQTGRGGSLTLKIKVAPGTKGGYEVDRITVVCERKLELPKPEQPADFYFVGENGEPTRKHPRQQELSLTDTQDTRGGFKTVSAAPVFSTPDADGVITPTKEAQQ